MKFAIIKNPTTNYIKQTTLKQRKSESDQSYLNRALGLGYTLVDKKLPGMWFVKTDWLTKNKNDGTLNKSWTTRRATELVTKKGWVVVTTTPTQSPLFKKTTPKKVVKTSKVVAKKKVVKTVKKAK